VIVVACLGDSITEGSPGWDRRRGGDEASRWQHRAAQLLPGAEFRSCGIYGQRTDEIAARLDECAHGADVLIVQGGINDIAQGRSIDEAATNMRRMIRRGRDSGARVLIANVLPWNNGWPARERAIRELNARVEELAAAEAVPVIDFHHALEDPERPGRMRNDLTSDGDHPSVVGYRILGELVAAALGRVDLSASL
jgi:lysophospholipase L1-like esterase